MENREELENLILKVEEIIGDQFVLVGSVSMFYNGFDKKSKKKEIDIQIVDEKLFDKLKTLGSHTLNENGERTPFKELKRMMIRTENNFFIDVYLHTKFSESKEILIKNRKIRNVIVEDYLTHYKKIYDEYPFFEVYDKDGRAREKFLGYINMFSTKE